MASGAAPPAVSGLKLLISTYDQLTQDLALSRILRGYRGITA